MRSTRRARGSCAWPRPCPPRASAPARHHTATSRCPTRPGSGSSSCPTWRGWAARWTSARSSPATRASAYKDRSPARLLGSLPLPAHPGSERHHQGCPRRRRRELRGERGPRRQPLRQRAPLGARQQRRSWSAASPSRSSWSPGIDSSFGTLMFTGAHANAGSQGVMAAQLRLRLLHGERQAAQRGRHQRADRGRDGRRRSPS